MARHGAPLGHAFTAHGFVHEHEKPEWGVYDGCGSRCEDDATRWCGCANEVNRQLENPNCPKEGEKRFAVYKISANGLNVCVAMWTCLPCDRTTVGAHGLLLALLL